MRDRRGLRRPRLVRPRRIIAYALAWLLLGSAVNYGQAAAFSAPRKFRFGANEHLRTPNGLTIRNDRVRSSIRVTRPEDRLLIPWYADPPLVDTPDWAHLDASPDATQVATGWPRRGLTGHIVQSSGAEVITLRSMVQLPPDHGLTFVPLRPIWGGFLLNALLWGSPVLLTPVFCVTVRVLGRTMHWRTARRLRRGLCPRCAYDLRTGMLPVCPECGFGEVNPA